MSEFIVEAFEVVDVNHNDCQPSIVTRSTLDFRSDLHLEVSPVIDARQSIAMSKLLRLLEVVRILNRSRTDIGYGFQRRNILRSEVSGNCTLEYQRTELFAKKDERHAHLGTCLHKAREIP